MGVLPLQFKEGMTRKELALTGMELFDVTGLGAGLKPRMDIACRIQRADGKIETIMLLCRIDTMDEVEYFRHGGILPYVLRSLRQRTAVARGARGRPISFFGWAARA